MGPFVHDQEDLYLLYNPSGQGSLVLPSGQGFLEVQEGLEIQSDHTQCRVGLGDLWPQGHHCLLSVLSNLVVQVDLVHLEILVFQECHGVPLSLQPQGGQVGQ